jgi:hypothetical protein
VDDNVNDGLGLVGEAGGRRIWTAEAVRGLGVMTDLETAASVLNIGRTKAYELAKQGQFPLKVQRVGRRYLVPVSGLLGALGLDADHED